MKSNGFVGGGQLRLELFRNFGPDTGDATAATRGSTADAAYLAGASDGSVEAEGAAISRAPGGSGPRAADVSAVGIDLFATGGSYGDEEIVGDGRARTDSANAERFAADHFADYRFSPIENRWYRRDKHLWRPDVTNTRTQAMVASARKLRKFAKTITDKGQRSAYEEWATRWESEMRLGAALRLAQTLPQLIVTETDTNPLHLGVLNGVVELHTGRLLKGSDGIVTRVAPVTYNPDATSESLDRFLAETTGHDPEIAAFLQRACGYSLTGDVSEEVMFFVFGRPRTGKSTFAELLLQTLGDYATTVPASTFTTGHANKPIRSDLAELRNRRLVTTNELAQRQHFDAALMKWLTGGDTMTVRPFHAKEITFRPTAKLWMFGNERPRLPSADDAVWRRVRVLPFDNPVDPASVDPDLKRQLITQPANQQAFLAYAVQGSVEWHRRRLDPPASVTHATAQYRAEADPLAQWMTGYLQFDPTQRSSLSDLTDHHRNWAERNGVAAATERAITAALRACGVEPHATGTARVWRGVSLNPDGTDTK